MIIQNEREKLQQKEREAELKLKDLNLLKMSLEKKTETEIKDFQRRFESQFEDEKRDIQRRRMKLEEEEHRYSINEKDKLQLQKENITLKDKLEKISTDHDKMMRDYMDTKDQLKVLSSNGLRDHEIINAKTSQASTYEHEAKTLRELLNAQKDMLANEKETNKEIISNLRQQLKEQKDMISQTRENLVSESEKQLEGYKNNYRSEREKYRGEIDHLNRKLD
jgi:hypothetical protein